MTSAQIDAAMRQRCPVLYGGIQYDWVTDRITEYVSWRDNIGQFYLSAVMLYRNGNCTVMVTEERVEENHEQD